MKKLITNPIVCLLIASLASPLLADNWPQWRGAGNDGISHEKSIATTWSQTENVVWRCPMPGQGGATPAIWGEKMFVTSADGDVLCLICIDTVSGQPLWRVDVTDGNQLARSGEGNSASASPSTDGEHVWVLFSRGENFSSAILACYDFEGQEVWKFDIADRFGKIDIQFGLTSTPVLHGDHLYLQLIHGRMARGDDTRTGKVIKLSKLTGETVWEVNRITDAEFECKHSYASPFLYDDGKQQFLVAHGADCTTGHALDTGKELWRFAGLNGPTDVNPGNHDATFRMVSSPAVVNGMIVIPTCKGGPTVALKVDETLAGDVGNSGAHAAWILPETPDVSIPLVADGLVYLLHKDGKLQCIEQNTGEQLYYQRTHQFDHRGSPILADGKIFYCAKDGVCTVVKAGRELDVLATNDMQEPITASPIVSDGVLYIRTFEAVYAIQ